MTEPPRAPSLLSNAHGSLRRVLLSIPWWIVRYRHQMEFAPISAAFEGLLRQLPASTRVVLATRRESADALGAWIGGLDLQGSTRVVAVSDELTLTAWAQDACLVVHNGDGDLHLVAPHDFDRQDDALVLAAVAEAIGIDHRTSPLCFQGGNVLVGDDFWLVGADSIQETVDVGLAESREAALEAFGTWLDSGRTLHAIGTDLPVPPQESRCLELPARSGTDDWTEIIRRGSLEGTRQPIFDLDAFVSLAGRGEDGVYRLLVGDPRMAAEITSTELPDHAVPDTFDDVADQLAGLGFRVFRNPLPLAYHDDRPSHTRLWYFASSNNVLSEIHGDKRNVWVPTYASQEWPALSLTDERNLEIWQELGFETHALPSFNELARDLGAARCLCKSLAR